MLGECHISFFILSSLYFHLTLSILGRYSDLGVSANLHISFYPPYNIVGYRNGYLKEENAEEKLIEDIARKKPDVVFVAMGSPKQELLMERIQKCHSAIFQGLGGSFDVYTGHVQRAPKWWVDHNLEFAYRLIKEPKRIKRQIHLVKYAYWLITKKI